MRVHPSAVGAGAPARDHIVNAPGTIDEGYRGELLVNLVNLDPTEPFEVRRGDRIAQLVVQRVAEATFVDVDSLSESSRGRLGTERAAASGPRDLSGIRSTRRRSRQVDESERTTTTVGIFRRSRKDEPVDRGRRGRRARTSSVRPTHREVDATDDDPPVEERRRGADQPRPRAVRRLRGRRRGRAHRPRRPADHPRRRDAAAGSSWTRSSRRSRARTPWSASPEVQLQAFAAPRTLGVWADIRTEIADSITARAEGRGRRRPARPRARRDDPHARVPTAGPAETFVRFIGVDGPRWFLRPSSAGPRRPTPTRRARSLEIVRSTVVVRDEEARPPREALPLQVPVRRDAGRSRTRPAMMCRRRPAQRRP